MHVSCPKPLSGLLCSNKYSEKYVKEKEDRGGWRNSHQAGWRRRNPSGREKRFRGKGSGGGGPAWVPEAPVPSPLLASTRWRNGSTFLERHYSSVSEEAESRSPRLPLGRQSPSSKRWLPLCRWGGVACGQRGPLREPPPAPHPRRSTPGSCAQRKGSAPSG